jgi:hypothetical protein
MAEHEILRLPVDADLAEASLEDALALVKDDMPAAGCLLFCAQEQDDLITSMCKVVRPFPTVALVPEAILDHPDSWALVGRDKMVVVPGPARPRARGASATNIKFPLLTVVSCEELAAKDARIAQLEAQIGWDA